MLPSDVSSDSDSMLALFGGCAICGWNVVHHNGEGRCWWISWEINDTQYAFGKVPYLCKLWSSCCFVEDRLLDILSDYRILCPIRFTHVLKTSID